MDYYQIPWVGVEYGEKVPKVEFDKVLIATPTISHPQDIRKYRRYKVPIICEKPITTNRKILQDLLDLDCDLSMVNQYDCLPILRTVVTTSRYDYFRSGKDGLIWDCINIIGLAKEPPKIANKSPVWDCVINGTPHSLVGMEMAYIDMITREKFADKEYIEKAHKRVWEGFYRIE